MLFRPCKKGSAASLFEFNTCGAVAELNNAEAEGDSASTAEAGGSNASSKGAGGSNANAGAVSVPLVALACQGGNVEIVDTAANAITSSFAVHNNQSVRGVRWLGNTRLVSFSYYEVLQCLPLALCYQVAFNVLFEFQLVEYRVSTLLLTLKIGDGKYSCIR